MEIEIHSIKSLELLAKEPLPLRTSLISIGDTNSLPPQLIHEPEHILRVVFHDITLHDVKDEFDIPADVQASEERLREFLKERQVNVFSDQQAKQIADFVCRYEGETELLICQCHYGQSRSAGCAAAIAEYYYGNGIDIFADYRFFPNKLVYHKVLWALKESEGLNGGRSRP
jgi:predicted protein tyrosine phosphatase